MNDHPIDAVREARRRISERFGHDPRKLVEHYMKLQERHKDRLVAPPQRQATDTLSSTTSQSPT